MQLLNHLVGILGLSSQPPTPLSSIARTAAIVDISNTIALFAILIDSHDYDRLDLVFTVTATADFNATGVPVCRGLGAIKERLSDLRDAPSQMALSTQYVNVTATNSAEATTYVVGTMFTSGWTEPSFIEYGRYHTDMVLTSEGWRVDKLVARGWATFDKWLNGTIEAPQTVPGPGILQVQDTR